MSSKEIVFSLPFNGTWLTFWGGDTAKQNHHHGSQSQQYAFDFIKMDDSDNFFRTNGNSNEDYFSFGLDILAPADGKIVELVNGLRDNKPRELNSLNFIGNYIMIKHDETTYSILGHLKQDSMTVKAGDMVISGEKLALCGNSGNTTDPHLHFHVQDSDIFAKVNTDNEIVDVAKGKKVYFSRIIVSKTRKSNYSPVKGDKVSNITNS